MKREIQGLLPALDNVAEHQAVQSFLHIKGIPTLDCLQLQ